MGWRLVACGVLGGLGLLLVAPLSVEAQPAAEGPKGLEPGTRVRVTYEAEPGRGGEETRLVGRVDALGSGSLRLDVPRSGEESIPREAIVRLERSIRPSHKTRGFLIGFGLGFAALFTWAEVDSNQGCFSGGHDCGLHAALSALLALPAGAVGAIAASGEEWAEVPLARLPVASGSRRHRGFQVGLAPLLGRQTGVALVGSF